MADALTFAAVEELGYLLAAADVTSSTSPEDLSLPGVWITVDSFAPRTVKGDLRITAALYLVVPNVDTTRAMEQLRDLYNQVRTVLTPDGPVVAQGVILPSAPTEPMPALRLPLFLPGSASALPLSDYVLETV